jgi:hypothetical protein
MGRSTLVLGTLVALLTLGGCGHKATVTAAAACKHAASLCEVDDDSDCAEALRALEPTLADSYQPLLTCAVEARSCPEVAGCLVGGAERVGDRVERQFGGGRDKMRGHHESTTTTVEEDSWSHHEEHHSGASPARGADVLATCRDFSSGDRGARWDGCADHVRRELTCKPFMDDELSCTCLEDGVHRWAFSARNPPLASRDDASRVARANCHMGFGND